MDLQICLTSSKYSSAQCNQLIIFLRHFMSYNLVWYHTIVIRDRKIDWEITRAAIHDLHNLPPAAIRDLYNLTRASIHDLHNLIRDTINYLHNLTWVTIHDLHNSGRHTLSSQLNSGRHT